MSFTLLLVNLECQELNSSLNSKESAVESSTDDAMLGSIDVALLLTAFRIYPPPEEEEAEEHLWRDWASCLVQPHRL